MKRRRQPQQKSKNPALDFIAFVSFSRDFAREIPGILERADKERLSVYLEQVQNEFPILYNTCEEAINMPPVEALAHIKTMFPLATFLDYIPNIYQIIAMIQNQLKERKQLHAAN